MPSSFRLARQLLSRIEDENTGEIKPEWLHIDITDKMSLDFESDGFSLMLDKEQIKNKEKIIGYLEKSLHHLKH